ncbi:MAG: hypothetical protein OXT67_07590, partial [Zetaproteobacteria bacterium]|nr:hypothetical protein [Zetaproteobacteria bacterium]
MVKYIDLMNTNKHLIRGFTFLSLCLIATIFVVQTQPSHGQSNCLGKPYGYPGCPLKDDVSNEETTELQHCGDGVINEGEKCDLGSFNGLSNCTENCELLFCGDGKITPYIGE